MVKVAIFYTLAGGGHISLACSAKEALIKHAPEKFEVKMFDPFPDTFASTHKTLINHFLEIYRVGYKVTENPQIEPTIRKLTDIAIKTNLLKFCKKFNPDIVIANHPLIAAVLPELQKKSTHQFKTVVHFADPFTTHQSWFYNKIADLYLSPTTEITQQIIAANIPSSKIKTIGWLLRDQFYQPRISPDIVKKTLGLEQKKFTIFLGGTGQGSSDTYELCSQITRTSSTQNLQVIVNTGLNAELIEKTLDLVRQHPDVFYLIPYIKNMPDILNACDLIVGKAGPNFMFETFAVNKPLIVTSYLPGQETGNIEYLEKNQLGWVTLDPQEAVNKIIALSKKSISPSRTHVKIHQRAQQKFTQEIIHITSPVRTPKSLARS